MAGKPKQDHHSEQGNMAGPDLSDRTETTVRFSEVDSIGIVWHGHFVKYLEDGRESFGRRYGLGYFDVFEKGLLTPIVKLDINYKLRVRYGETVVIETTYVKCDAAKIIFDYTIYRKSDHAVVLTASSTQAFVNEQGELELTNPEFYQDWKKKHGLDPQVT
jgi:acyl-CoA thioester hydrolase